MPITTDHERATTCATAWLDHAMTDYAAGDPPSRKEVRWASQMVESLKDGGAWMSPMLGLIALVDKRAKTITITATQAWFRADVHARTVRLFQEIGYTLGDPPIAICPHDGRPIEDGECPKCGRRTAAPGLTSGPDSGTCSNT